MFASLQWQLSLIVFCIPCLKMGPMENRRDAKWLPLGWQLWQVKAKIDIILIHVSSLPSTLLFLLFCSPLLMKVRQEVFYLVCVTIFLVYAAGRQCTLMSLSSDLTLEGSRAQTHSPMTLCFTFKWHSGNTLASHKHKQISTRVLKRLLLVHRHTPYLSPRSFSSNTSFCSSSIFLLQVFKAPIAGQK